MGRRKRAFLEDDLDSSEDSDRDDLDEQGFEDNDPDAQAERNLFEDPYQQRKRRRVAGKDDATYGIFAEDEEDEGFGRRTGKRERRLHFTERAPSFVTSEGKNLDLDEGLEREDEGEEVNERDDVADEESEEEALDESPAPEPRVPRVDEEPVEERPRIGLGAMRSVVRDFASAGLPSRGGIGSSHNANGTYTREHESPQAGSELGSTTPENTSSTGPSRGGIGSRKLGLGSVTNGDPFPSAFGMAPRAQRSFIRDGTGSSPSTPDTPRLSNEEKVHFRRLEGSLGGKLLAKMGWETGTGLGVSGKGIVTPIETKLRPKASMGLAFKGFKEKTAQSKAEAKRRGEVVSEDEETGTKTRGSRKGTQRPSSDAWKKPRRTKSKVEYQTYEQIVQNAGQDVQPVGVGKIYDATSGEMREVTSLADIASASWTPSTDTMRIPEVRHNLRLIVDAAKSDLDGLAREAKALEERKKWVHDEDARLRRKVQDEAELIARLQRVHLIVDEIKTQSQLHGRDPENSLDTFSPHIEKLITDFSWEYDVYRLDEIVVAAISPMVQQSLTSWHPLHDPTLLVDVFNRWRRALKFSTVEDKGEVELDAYATQSIKPKERSLNPAMTPYESLLWNIWLPRVRSCINNDWVPLNATPAIQLYEAWSSILPRFICDNILDQLVIPKVQKGIDEWEPREGWPALRAIVFPWLPHLGLRIEALLDEAKRKIKSYLRIWLISDGVPEDLIVWKDVFGEKEWNSMMLKYIVPKLGVTLREDFKVNPRSQDMIALEQVLSWRTFLSSSIFSQLLETEFFPKWLDVLHIWLIQPNASFEEVAQWYAFWKGTFSPEVLDLPGVAHGFTRGLQLMNRAIELGPEASKLPRPNHNTSTQANNSRQGTPKIRSTPSRATEITFRSIVEDHASSHDLLFIPTGRAHEKSRMPLFRVSHNMDGKGGILVYILDDAVWALEGDGYCAISLEDMVLRANRSR